MFNLPSSNDAAYENWQKAGLSLSKEEFDRHFIPMSEHRKNIMHSIQQQLSKNQLISSKNASHFFNCSTKCKKDEHVQLIYDVISVFNSSRQLRDTEAEQIFKVISEASYQEHHTFLTKIMWEIYIRDENLKATNTHEPSRLHIAQTFYKKFCDEEKAKEIASTLSNLGQGLNTKENQLALKNYCLAHQGKKPQHIFSAWRANKDFITQDVFNNLLAMSAKRKQEIEAIWDRLSNSEIILPENALYFFNAMAGCREDSHVKMMKEIIEFFLFDFFQAQERPAKWHHTSEMKDEIMLTVDIISKASSKQDATFLSKVAKHIESSLAPKGNLVEETERRQHVRQDGEDLLKMLREEKNSLDQISNNAPFWSGRTQETTGKPVSGHTPG